LNSTDFAKLQKRGNYDSQIKPLDFYRGVDISSIISLENSGIRFYNQKGQEEDLFKILADIGVNCIRVRIWNSPKTTSGVSYGGGNNDLETAVTIGKRAAKYGLTLFVNFHYSDFWADPGKQTIPKEWKNFNLDKRVFEIYRFTKGCVEWLLENGSVISMFQIGNETTCFMCGEDKMENVMKMMSNGAKAIRDISKNITVVLHFTNPNKPNNMLWYASELASAKVDYDVYATSYYPFWHGTLDNLKNTLNEIANKYGKKILIAEYSYIYTNAAKTADGNSYGSVKSGNSDITLPYPVSVDGQTQCIKDIYKTIKSVKNGIGAFYWEPAWIAPPARNDAERRQIWEKYGSSWASKAAAEYDKSASPYITGGTEWENQAVFDQSGKALSSLLALGDGAAPTKYTVEQNNTTDQKQNQDQNQGKNNNQDCFSIRLGFPCCTTTTEVYYTDNDGQWGIENNNWCGLSTKASTGSVNCTGKNYGYKCCSNCIVYYTDTDGRWGVENNDWCGIKDTC